MPRTNTFWMVFFQTLNRLANSSILTFVMFAWIVLDGFFTLKAGKIQGTVANFTSIE